MIIIISIIIKKDQKPILNLHQKEIENNIDTLNIPMNENEKKEQPKKKSKYKNNTNNTNNIKFNFTNKNSLNKFESYIKVPLLGKPSKIFSLLLTIEVLSKLKSI